MFLTKNGRGRYVVMDIQEYEKTQATLQLDLNLVLALVYALPILILDQPQAGLDPQSRTMEWCANTPA